ncbi:MULTISPECIES: DUF6115 domain-containing protein [unclassified Campylobacter]|uniref:DUF6115 domain-containing protein n=1 Tax=unclassified Campylobacter TaxID=2593542 RepID=UPI003D3541E6
MQTILVVGVLVVLAIFFLFLLIKEGENNRRFSRYEKALEGLMQENFTLKKHIEALEFPISENISEEDIENRLKIKLEQTLDDKLAPIIGALNNMGSVMDEFASDQQSRLYHLEERTREINKFSPSSENDEGQIMRLYNEGKSVETIARDMRIGVGRVEFVLKLNNLI